MKFTVWCSARKVGAIGIASRFRFDCLEAGSVDAVKERVRSDLYSDGYEHVLIENVGILKSE